MASWAARKIFTKRIPHSVEFAIDGEEFRLYRDVTAFVKAQSSQAATQGEDARARAVGFLMALYQRRLASSTHTSLSRTSPGDRLRSEARSRAQATWRARCQAVRAAR